MAISKHLLFTVLFLVGFPLAFSEPPDNRRPPRSPPPPRRSPPPPRPRSPPPPRPSPPPSPPPPTPSPPPPPSNPPRFDYFLLVLQWPNAYCFASYMKCDPPTPKQYFTIHGLWPQMNYGGQPQFCNTDQRMPDAILKKNEEDLLKYWPRFETSNNFVKSKKLWIDQWNKHGTCSSNKFSPEAYLETTIALAKKYGPLILKKMEERGIKPDRTTLYTAEKILEAIKEATKTAAMIRCSDLSGKLELDDIRLCVKADGKTLQDCTKDPVGNCKGQFLFPSEPTKTYSRFPSFVSSILDVEEAVGI